MMNHYKIKVPLGFSIFCLIIYNRIFRIREEKLFLVSFNLLKVIFYFAIALTMLYLCIYNALIFYRWIKNIEIQKSKNKIIIFLNENLIYILKNP